MDTSKEYVKMCEKAEEIQKEFRGLYDSYVFLKWRHGEGVSLWSACCRFENIERVVWLPTQSQLQEMVEWKDTCRDAVQRDLFELAGKIFDTDDCISWEEFWLRVVMYEKYRKVWDDQKEEWREDGI